MYFCYQILIDVLLKQVHSHCYLLLTYAIVLSMSTICCQCCVASVFGTYLATASSNVAYTVSTLPYNALVQEVVHHLVTTMAH